jgi:hypothetical protein
MLNTFDWLRRCASGAELLATLRYFAKPPRSSWDEQEIGAPFSALNGPCERCYLYTRCGPNEFYCQFCKTIVERAKRVAFISRKAVIVWGFVNHLPQSWQTGSGVPAKHLAGSYVHEEHRFLMMMNRRKLKSWLQNLILYHGADLKGLIQIFPPLGARGSISMGDILCYVANYEPRVPLERLHVKFYSSPFHLLKPRERDRQGLLNFEAAEFLSLLEMTEVFRALLYPAEQRQLRELLDLQNPKEEQFYWGRFLGQLHQEAKDMLAAWRIRQWPKSRIKLLYELTDYAELPDSH